MNALSLSAIAASSLPAKSICFDVSPNVRSLHFEKDGAILLDIATGKYFSLNPVAASIWRSISEGAGNADTLQLAESLACVYGVSSERLRDDVTRFLQSLMEKGILIDRASGSGRGRTVRGNGGLRIQDFKETSSSPSCTSNAGTPSHSFSSRLPTNTVKSCFAFGLLVVSDIALWVGGFSQLHKFVGTFAVRFRKPESNLIPLLCGSVDRATRWYLKPAWCLQRSVATACMLRWHGIGARLVIGCRKIPFSAHAWVEVDGAVVNDRPTIAFDYSVIEVL